MTRLAFASFLLFTVMVATVSSQGGLGSCCRKISTTQVHRERLTRYYTENDTSCPLQAVVFITTQGKRICSDPTKLWTQTSMAFLDGKNWQLLRMIRQQ